MMMVLNDAQARAVNLYTGPALVLAGPGSGKTAVITQHIINLINTHKVTAGKIMVVTFSRKAADEMKSRFNKLLNEEQKASMIHSEKESSAFPLFGTFHSIFFMILRSECGYSHQSIIADSKKLELLRSEVDRLNIFYESENDFFQSLISDISRVKNRFVNLQLYNPSLISKNDFIRIYNYYEKTKKEFGLIDYDDMMHMCFSLLSSDEHILNRWRNRFSFFLIDEFQDINPIQYKIIKMLASPSDNIFAVGDDDQCIYGFRGSSPVILKSFMKDFPNAEFISLTTNYRSTKEITRAASKVILSNKNRYDKSIKSFISDAAPESVKIRSFESLKMQYSQIAEEIKSSKSSKKSFSDTAILVRSLREAREISEILFEKGIPVGAFKNSNNIFDSFIANDIITYMKLSNSFDEHKSTSSVTLNDFVRVMNKPSRYISRNSLAAVFPGEKFNINIVFKILKRHYRASSRILNNICKFENDLKFISHLSPFAAIQYIRNVVKYNSYLKELCEKNKTNYSEYEKTVSRLEESCFSFSSLMQWQKYIEEYNLQSKSNDQNQAGSVNILTMHSSKGLEFDTVYILSVNETVIPNKNCVSPEQIEEECRLLYVAMTRAKKQLFVCYTDKIRSKQAAPSRFLNCLLDTQKNNSE